MNRLNNRFECELPPDIRKRFEPVDLQPKRKEAAAPPPVPSPSRKADRLWMLLAFAGLLLYGFNTFKPASSTPNKVTDSSPVISRPSAISPKLRSVELGAQPSLAVRRGDIYAPRAEPVVLRAEPVIGANYPVAMPDGKLVYATFRGYLRDVSQLPLRGGSEGDMYGIGTTTWILTIPAGGGRLSWIDP